jgi:hypothetical protein
MRRSKSRTSHPIMKFNTNERTMFCASTAPRRAARIYAPLSVKEREPGLGS